MSGSGNCGTMTALMARKRKTQSAADDAKAILNRVRHLVRLLRVFEKEAQSQYGLGAAKMFILHVLSHDEEISLNELADRTAVDQSSASLAVGRLVETGHVRRTVSPEDRRQVRLALTAKGKAVVRRSPPAAQERILESVQSMPPRDRAQLMTLLDQLMAGMGPPASGPAPMLFEDGAAPSKKRRR
jgi:DNA-binding MarR family transcriptional regulator